MVKSANAPGGLIVLICFLIAAIEGYDIQAFGIAAPKLVPELGLDPGQQGWAASAGMIGLVIGAFVGGLLADRVGRKPVLLASVAAFGLFSLGTAASHSYEVLLLARLATGLGFGGAFPNLVAIATEISGPARRSVTVTAMFCGMPAGGAASALFARLAGEALDWRVIFLVGGAIPLVLLPLAFALLPETRPHAEPGADRNLARGLFAERRAAPTLFLWAAFMMTTAVLYLALNWLPTLIVDSGHPPSLGFAAALAFNVSAVVGSLVLGAICDRTGWRAPLVAAFLALAAALAGLAAADQAGPILALSGLAGFLVVGAQFCLYAVTPGVYPAQLRAAGTGAAIAVGRLGSIAGPLIAGELRNAGATPGEVFAAMAPAGLAAAVLLLLLSRVAHSVAEPVNQPG